MTRTTYTPQSDSALVAAVEWLNGLVLGNLAVGLCVIAVAVVGLMMFGGRLPVRQGLRVILGCFILLGAPVIASAFTDSWEGAAGLGPQDPFLSDSPEVREHLDPAEYDPYAGASLRRD